MTIRYSRIVWRQHSWGLGRAWFWGKLGITFQVRWAELLPPRIRAWATRAGEAGFKTTLFCFRWRTKLWERFVASFGSSMIAGLFRFLLSFVLIPSFILREHPVWSWISGRGGLVVIYTGLWALEGPSCEAWICVLRFWFVVLLRWGRLPFASQLGWLGPLQHGANIGQTQLRLVYSGASHELRSCLPPLVLLGNPQQPSPNSCCLHGCISIYNNEEPLLQCCHSKQHSLLMKYSYLLLISLFDFNCYWGVALMS